jgi:hypothetical protein
MKRLKSKMSRTSYVKIELRRQTLTSHTVPSVPWRPLVRPEVILPVTASLADWSRWSTEWRCNREAPCNVSSRVEGFPSQGRSASYGDSLSVSFLPEVIRIWTKSSEWG